MQQDTEPIFYEDYSLQFDGVDDYIDIANRVITDESTISIWLYFDDILHNHCILSHDTNNEYLYIDSVERLVIGFNSVTQGNFGWDEALEADKWYHYVITRNGTEMKAYRNAIEADETSYTSPQTTSDLDWSFDWIGKSFNGTTFFKGRMSELYITIGATKIASQSDVNDLYNGGVGVSPSSVIASSSRWHKFNSTGTSTTLGDQGADAATGSLTNFPTSGMWVGR